MNAPLSLNQDYVVEFNPKEYLRDNYDGPDEEHTFNIKFLVEAIQSLPANLMVLELGAGPTLHSAAVVAPRAREIHICDYVPANLDEIRCWLNSRPDAFDWSPFIKAALVQAGDVATAAAVEERAHEMRRKITQLRHCDVLQSRPLGEFAQLYDLVLAPHCTDVAAATLSQWVQVMQNVSTLVKAGGWLFIAVTTGSSLNTVGSKVFPCVDLSDQDIYQGYIAAGFDPDSYRLAKIVADSKYEFTGVCYALAQKK